MSKRLVLTDKVISVYDKYNKKEPVRQPNHTGSELMNYSTVH